MTIGAVDGRAVEEARRRIALILDPPTADVGEVYQGKVVNITKFGAFVSILPGRDGLLHISKMSVLNDGKRVGQVEDVVELGQAIEVRVDDIDPQGKVSLSVAGAEAAVSRDDSEPVRETLKPSAAAASASSAFEASFEAELEAELGDLGPGGPLPREDRGPSRGGRNRRRS